MEGVEDLQVFLRLYDIRADIGELENLWEGIGEPILVDEKKGWDNDNLILQIVKVWELDNTRIALWNNREVDVHYPKSRVYDYIDEGRYAFRGILLLFDPVNPGVLGMIKKYWGMMGEELCDYRDLQFFRDDEPKFTLSYEEFSSMVRRFERTGRNAQNVDLELLRAWMKKVNDGSSNGLDAVKLDDKFIYADGMRFGVDGMWLEEYLIPYLVGYREHHHPHWEWYPGMNLDGVDRDCVMEGFYSGVRSLSRDGVYTLWLGKYAVQLRIQHKNRRLCRLIEGVKVRRLDFLHALEQGLEHPKPEYRKFLRKLWKNPEYVSQLREEGVDMVLFNGPGSDLNITLKFDKVGGRWYLISPVDGEMYHIPGGFRKIRSLNDDEPPSMWGPLYYGDVFEFYMKLRDVLPLEHIIRVICTAREEQREAERKSRRLLGETLEKYPDRVKEGKFAPDRQRYGEEELRGYVVKGKRRNYFLEKDRNGVFTYPEGRYVCIVDDGKSRGLPNYDKLISRMYLLMNDDELEAEVHTLRHGDELVLRAN